MPRVLLCASLIRSPQASRGVDQLLRHMDMIAVRIEQAIADVFPRPLTASPRAEELDWISIRLCPSPVTLQRLVEPPAQVRPSFPAGDPAAYLRAVGSSGALEGFIPSLLPAVEPNAAYSIDVSCAANLVMADHPGLKEKAAWLFFIKPGLHGKSLQNFP